MTEPAVDAPPAAEDADDRGDAASADAPAADAPSADAATVDAADEPDATPALGPPSVTITSPENGATVTATGNPLVVPVTFRLANFVLAAAGSCNGVPQCGHAHLTMAEPGCNDVRMSYNAVGATPMLNARLAPCAWQAGAHTVTIELQNDAHRPFNPPLTSTVSFIVSE